jgi:3-hydroxybutyryl-CoA dehydrogenase
MDDLRKLNIGIIGSGMIGMSEAALLTGNGFGVTVLTQGPQFTEQGKQHYDGIFRTIREKKLLSHKQIAGCSKRLRFTESYDDIADADVVFECAFENVAVKHSVYKLIEQHCKNLKALASTSSAIASDELAQGLTVYKDRMMVAHPFNPPHAVLFVEIVKNSQTKDEPVKLIYDLLEFCGRKVVVMKKPAPGFISNRLQHALIREAVYMVEQGYASPEDIDKTLMYSFMPRYTSVGLFEHQDVAGLDLITYVHDYLFPHLCTEQRAQELFASRVKAGKLGAKTGEGVYTWTEEQKESFRQRTAEPYWKDFNWNCPQD